MVEPNWHRIFEPQVKESEVLHEYNQLLHTQFWIGFTAPGCTCARNCMDKGRGVWFWTSRKSMMSFLSMVLNVKKIHDVLFCKVNLSEIASTKQTPPSFWPQAMTVYGLRFLLFLSGHGINSMQSCNLAFRSCTEYHQNIFSLVQKWRPCIPEQGCADSNCEWICAEDLMISNNP